MTEKYWMVHGPTRGPATLMHRAFLHAVTEAKRLAVKNPGEVFLVMEAVTGFCAEVPTADMIELRTPDYIMAEEPHP